MAQRLGTEQVLNLPLSAPDESKLDTSSPFRWRRSKSIDDVHRQMVRSYISHVGALRTDFPDPKVSPVVVWLRACLKRLGRGSLDYSLLIFHKNNRFRKNVKKAVKSKFFNIFFGVVVLLNAVLLCIHQPTVWDDYKQQNIILAYVSVLFLIAYVVESGMRVIAYGLIFHPKAYLRSADNILDLFPILFGVLYLFLTVAGMYVLADTFGALMSIKLIRVLSVFKTVRFILRALAKSMVPLIFVSIMQLCVMIFFTFLGMELFQGCGLDNGCFANYTAPNGEVNLVVVSDFPCPSPGDEGTLGVHQCPSHSQCLHWMEGPNYGFTSFEDFRKGLLTVFQLITLEGWTGIFYLYESACGVMLTWPYFIIAITLGSVLFLNLWMGVLTSVFIGVSERQETETNIRQLKEKKKNEKDLDNYHKWIQKSLDMDLPSESGSIGRRHSLPVGLLWLSSAREGSGGGYDSDDEQYLDAELDLQQRRQSSADVEGGLFAGRNSFWLHAMVWVTQARTVVLTVVKSRPHFFLKLLVLAVNLVLLMSLHFPHIAALDRTVFIFNYVLSCLFILESMLSLFALGPRRYFSSQFHRMDTVLNILNLVDLMLIPVLGKYHFSAIINACRSIKLIKIFKYTRYWISMKQIIHTFTRLMSLSLSLMALVVLYLFMYTIVGNRLFGLRLDIDHSVGLPNFDNLLTSFLLVFQLMTTEDWHNVFHASSRAWLRASGSFIFTPLYFTTAIMLGGFVLLSIFLSIAVDKLSEVKTVEVEEGREVEERDRERDNKKRQIQALKHPEEASLYHKTLRRARWVYNSIRIDTNQKKDWKKPFPTSGHVQLRRALSTKSNTGGGTAAGQTDHKEHGTPKRVLKQANPLRFIMNPRSRGPGGEEDSLALKSLRSRSPMGSDHRSSEHSQSSKQTASGVWDEAMASRRIKRKQSTVSSPETPLPRTTSDSISLAKSYERTQSLPMDQSSTSAATERETEETVATLETITEGSLTWEETAMEKEITAGQRKGEEADQSSESESQEAVTEGMASRPCPLSPNAPPSPCTERDVTLRRTQGQSSLENVTFRKSEVEREQESTDGFEISWSKWKYKLLRMWHWFTDYIGTIQFDPTKELAEIPNHSAFFILSPDNSFRVFCYKVVRSKAFNVVTYVTIFLGSVLLTLEIPVNSSIKKGTLICQIQEVIIFVDLVIVIYFLVEMFLKMTALGVFLHRGSYLRGFFNIIDFIITMTTFVPIMTYFYNSTKPNREKEPCLAYSYQESLVPVYLATLRVFRVFRPMRAIRISAFYVVVTGLLSSIKSIGRILVINVLVMSIFAIIGTIIFRGSFFYCTDPSKITERECKGHFFTYPTGDLSCPELNERRWLRHGLNFDNFGQSFLTLFSMITSEGWELVMYNGYNSKLFQDSNEPVGPRPSTSPYAFIFFLLYMCTMTLVLLNMFIGFVIVTFQEVGIKAFRESKLDRNQRNCLYYALTTKPQFRYVPKFKWQERLLELTRHPVFSACIILSLICNSIILALQTIKGAKEAIYWINLCFTLLFTVEAVLKITALHPVNYFRNLWNFLEFLSTTGALLEFILQQTVISSNSAFRYSHFASSFRVLWLLRFVPQVRLIMWTVIKSLEIFPWVGLLLLFVVFTFAVIGMQVFGSIKRAPIEASEQFPGRHITQYNNFANFPQALLVMIRVTTGENWQDVMLSCKSNSPCENSGDNTCGSDAAYFFYPFFYAIASILFLNLFVAIIIDNFDYLVKDKSVLGAHQLSTFVKLWSIYDPSASGKLSPEEVIKLMKQCNPPVGWGILCPRVVTYRKMMDLNMPLVNEKVTFNATLFGLVKTSLSIGCIGCSECLYKCNVQLKEKLRILFPTSQQKILDEILPTEDVSTVRPGYAVHLIQSKWRAFVRKRNETIQIFQGKEKRSLIAGQRRLPDAGPELLERKLSDFELEELSIFHSPTHGSRSSLSAVQTATPASLSGFRFSFDQPHYDRQTSERWRESELLPSSQLTEGPMFQLEMEEPYRREQNPTNSGLWDPFEEKDDDDEQSELSFSSAVGTPVKTSLTHHQIRETTV